MSDDYTPKMVRVMSDALGLELVKVNRKAVREGGRTVFIVRPVYDSTGSGDVVAKVGIGHEHLYWRM